MNDELDQILTVPESVLFQEVSGESVLLDLESEQYFGLNGVGTRAWQLMLEHRRLTDVLEVLQAEYDVPPDVLRSDLLDLVKDLRSSGLLLVGDPASDNAPAP
jgi:hypothetical protein